MKKRSFYVLTYLILLLFIFSPLAFSAQDIQRLNHADLIDTINKDNGRAVLVVFWATWCKPCQEKMPELNKLRSQFAKDKLNILAVSIDYSPQMLASYLNNYQLDFPIYLATSDVTNIFRVQGVPKFMLYDQQGQCVLTHSGKYPIQKLQGKITKLIKR
jgi:thiol-disulfide isomerase/thioredoxin